MKKRIAALFFAIVLLITCLGQATAEENYTKVADDLGLYSQDFMVKYAKADPDETIWAYDMEVTETRAFVYMNNFKLYTSDEIVANIHVLCELTPYPEDWLQHEMDGTLTDEEIEKLYNTVTDIVTRDGKVYGFNSFSGRFGPIDGKGVHWNEVKLDVSPMRAGNSEIRCREMIRSFLSEDDQYYYLIYDENYEYGELYRFDLATGSYRRYEVERLVTVYPYKDGNYMVQRVDEKGAYVISELNVETGELTDLDYDLSQFNHEDMQRQACGLAYDSWGGKDPIVVFSDGMVYRIYPGEKPLVCDVCPDIDMVENNRTTLEGSSNYYVYGMSMALLTLHEYGHETDPDDISRVTIAGGFPQYYDAQEVLKELCGDLNIRETWEVTGEELADQLNMKNDSVDIYVLPADSTYYSILKKGLAADLSSSLTISEDVEAMYEPIRELLVNGQGQVVAYPADLRVRRFGINEGYWNQVFPDRPLPRTFSEVMDAWIEWEENWAEEYRGVGFFMGEFDYADTVRRLISLYVEQHADEELPDLTAPALREVLEKLQRVYEIRTEAGRSTSYDVPDELLADTGETGPGIVFWCDVRDAAYVDSTATLTYDSDYIHGVLKAHWTPLNITFEADAAPYTGARMSVYVVNPYTKHLGDAIRVVEALTERAANPYLYYAAYPEHNEPYEKPGFEDELRRSEEQVKLYEASIEKAKAAGKDTDKLEGQLNYYKTLIENQESEKWVVSQETIDAYRKTVEECPLRLNAQSPYSDQDGGLSTVISQMSYRLADGQVTLDEMLSTIQDRAKMMYLENK